jgi:hypothetical protein
MSCFHPTQKLRASLLLTTLVALGAPLGAQDSTLPGLSGAERRERTVAQFQAVVDSVEYKAFERAEQAGKVDAETLEHYLEWLPVPPNELFAIRQEQRIDTTPVPESVDRRQTQWVKLHEADARALYGDRYVDARLGRLAADSGAAVRAARFTEGNTAIGTYQHYEPQDYQGEVMLAVNPNNANQVLVASNTWGEIPGLCATESTIAIGASQDGGKSWTYTCAPPSTTWALGSCPAGAGRGGADPAVAWNGSGHAFVNYLVVCRVSDADIRTAVVTLRSLDGGVTWATQGLVSNGWTALKFNDKNMFAIDTQPGSPYFNRQYTCWDRDSKAVVAYSANGTGWTEVPFAPMLNSNEVYGCELAVGKDGVVHLALNSDDSNSPSRVTYFRSNNGGASWTGQKWLGGIKLTPFQKPAAQDARGIFPFASIDVDNSDGPCAGNLYIVYSDFSAGETVASTDVWLQRSVDGGLNWSSRIKINDDALSGRAQFHPAMRVDPSSGDLYAAWYDARNSSTNRAVEIYAARSLDCGASFEPNVRVASYSPDFRNFVTRASNENSIDNALFNPNQFGEYMGLDAAAGRAYIAWVDTREFYPSWTDRPEKENLGFTRVDFGATCGNALREGLEVCDGVDLAGKSCVTQGFPGGSLGCYSDCRAFYTGGCTGERFYSYEMYDGSVEAFTFGILVAADSNDGHGLRIGDSVQAGARKGFLSFDTSEIPDNAVIKSATLHLYRAAVVGSNPFSSGLGSLSVVMSHAFSGNIALETADFSAASLGTAGCTPGNPASDHGLSLCKLSASALTRINKAGHTQFRLAFNTSTNGNGKNDYMAFFDGASLGAIERPVLVVEY